MSTKYGTITIKNCALFAYDGTIPINNVASASTITVSYSATSYATLAGTGNVTSLTYTSQFESVSSGTLDYRAKSGGGILDVGTDLSADSPAITTDIVGTSRPQNSTFDIGCWELVVAGGGSFPMGARSHRYPSIGRH